MSTVINRHARSTRPVFGIGQALGFVGQLVAQIRKRREMNYLLSLPDYQLKDIGLQRGDIQREALKPLWRR
jgi:uncharacterized protein YjiS (DUF1127 family)